jgi:hypothetical protein
LANESHNPCRDGLEWTIDFDRIRPNRLLGHSEDQATGFILRDGERSGLPHGQQAAGTVITHARQNDAYCIGSGIAGR